MSRFFNTTSHTAQHRLKAKVSKTECYCCKGPLKKANVHNSVWQFNEHVGYVCDAPDCKAVLAKRV